MKQTIQHTQVSTQNSVAATVILFNSPPACLENLLSYLHQVERLYIMDNSPTPTQWAMNEYHNNPAVVYRHFPENVGIATALNTAAQLAIQDGFTYLLTMDDDSQAPIDLISKMLGYLASVKPETVGIVAPRHTLLTAPNQPEKSQQATPILTTMTSGNLLDLRIYAKIGPFCDALFIDVVDHEYDLRLNRAGYQIIELPYLKLVHRLGEQKQIHNTSRTYVSHNPVRNYYLVRNSLFVSLRYWNHRPHYMLTALRTISIETAKAILFENKRLLRLQLIGKAISDGLRKRMGKLPHIGA